MRRASLTAAALILLPQVALAHMPLPEATGFGAGALRVLWFPDQALAMLALALLVAPFPPARLRSFLPALAIGFALGLLWGRPELVADSWLYAAACVAAALAALAPGRWVGLVLALVVVTGAINGAVCDPYPGPQRPDFITLTGTMAGALGWLLLLWALPRLLLSAVSRPWAGIALRILSAWVCAISALMLALLLVQAG
jgi:hypothetical protein